MTAPAEIDYEQALIDDIAQYYDDPLGFVMYAWPWGEPGPLQSFDGPDQWQREVLVEIGELVKANKFDVENPVPVEPIRESIASGHGIGKGVLAAFIANWILSTRPHSLGTVTANTFPQLKSRTWATICTWFRRSINAHWWNITGAKIHALTANGENDWYLVAQTCREENSESFAGQHAAIGTSFYIFDEASNISRRIFEVAEGGLSDGEPMIFVFGNPTRSNGVFHEITFGSKRNLWHARSIDSRDCKMTNKNLIAKWGKEYGEDSDFFRVRVKGLPPNASDLQFIASDTVHAAQQRQVVVFPDEPLICGLDVARGGADNCWFYFRKGLDGRSAPSLKVPGEKMRDSMLLVTMAADVLNRTFSGGERISAMFIDETGVGGPIVDRLKQLGHHNVFGVQFGGKAPDIKYLNMRAYMWAEMREWLQKGAIPNDEALEMDLTGPGYHHVKDALCLESKEDMKDRGLDSPDQGDGLALTFARKVAPISEEKLRSRERQRSFRASEFSWMG